VTAAPLAPQWLAEIRAQLATPKTRQGDWGPVTVETLLGEIDRLTVENEQLADLDAAATRRSELQAERDRAVTRWHEEHQRAQAAETERDGWRERAEAALDEAGALQAEILKALAAHDRLTRRLADAVRERDEARARIAGAHTEIRRQDVAATEAMRPGYCDVSDALAAVETHLVGPGYRPAPDAQPQVTP